MARCVQGQGDSSASAVASHGGGNCVHTNHSGVAHVAAVNDACLDSA